MAVHAQIVTFHLRGMTRAQFDGVCDQVAPAIAALPGLISKLWLADEATNTYGGVYLWRDHAAMEAYFEHDVFRALVANPQLADITSRDFEVMERQSAVTRVVQPVSA